MKVDLSQKTIDELREIFKISMEDRDLFMKGQKVAFEDLDKKDMEIENLKLQMKIWHDSILDFKEKKNVINSIDDLTLEQINLILECAEKKIYYLDMSDYLRLKNRKIDLECVSNVVEVYDWNKFYFKLEDKALKIIKRSDI